MARLILVLAVVAICFWTLASAFNANRQLSPKRHVNNIKVKVLPHHPEQKSKYREGDIRPNLRKIAVADPTLMWPRGEVPYVIDDYDDESIALIESSMDELAYYTCIRFVPRTTEVDYINITSENGCSSHIGRQGGVQILSLSEDCLQRAIIVHELMHSLGYYHEHSRPDRDIFVEIVQDNIAIGAESYFDLVNLSEITDLQTQYDYESIMHYDAFAFAADSRKPTMVPSRAEVSMYTIGESPTLSQVDRTEVIRFYKCTGANGGGTGGNQTVSLLAGSCDFETYECGWTNKAGTPLTWQRYQGSTPAIGTGPNGDKTTGKGYYMLMEGSLPSAQPYDNAELISPIIKSTSVRHCIEISFHKQGSQSELNIYLVYNGISDLLHTITDDQGEYWKKTKLALLELLPLGFQISIEAVRGEDAKSDVAIDDIYIRPDFC